ncbi:MAG: GAF domain-containing protein, partial [Chloroflexota bacterium]|nr:GAF domain-containing protein [Chloroflexota bacterium]
MKVGTRIFITFLVVALIPLGVTGWRAGQTIRDVKTLAISQSEAALTALGEQSIHAQALSVARQIELYLHAHPELDLHDDERLESDTALARIAVQSVGETGYTAIFDEKGITHFHANPATVGMNMNTLAEKLPDFWAIFSASMDGSLSDGYYDWEDADGQIRAKYMSVVPVGDTRLRVAATTYIDEFSQPVVATASQLDAIGRDALQQLLIFMVVVAVVMGILATFFSRQLALPIQQIADMATRVAGGERIVLQPSTRRDEIGVLHRAFSAMTTQLQQTLEGLEQQVAKRTRDLEHRAVQLQAAAKVARDAASVLDIEELMSTTVERISELFGLYHAGIFLVDDAREHVVLRAVSSANGERTVAKGFQLKIGAQGIVGRTAQSGQPRVVPDVKREPFYFAHPDLPETRSEMTLPLRVRGETVGVLDVQSTEPGAFSDEDVATLGTMADQLAVAIENARLFEQTQASLREAKSLYRGYSKEAWGELVRAGRLHGYTYDQVSVSSVTADRPPEVQQSLREGRVVTVSGGYDGGNESVLAVPVSVRGEAIGVLDIRKSEEAGEWTPEELLLA